MISFPQGTKVWLAAGKTDMRRGIQGLGAIAQTVLHEDPLSGHVFVFRGRNGDRLKLLYFDGQGFCLFYKVIGKSTFIWPAAKDGKVSITAAQLASLLEGMDYRLTQAASPVACPTQFL